MYGIPYLATPMFTTPHYSLPLRSFNQGINGLFIIHTFHHLIMGLPMMTPFSSSPSHQNFILVYHNVSIETLVPLSFRHRIITYYVYGFLLPHV